MECIGHTPLYWIGLPARLRLIFAIELTCRPLPTNKRTGATAIGSFVLLAMFLSAMEAFASQTDAPEK
jgi:hypothetical protein